MSTNGELIGRIRGIAANYEAEDATGDLFEEIADALEAATYTAEVGQVMHARWQERAERAEATLAEVREEWEIMRPAVPNWLARDMDVLLDAEHLTKEKNR